MKRFVKTHRFDLFFIAICITLAVLMSAVFPGCAQVEKLMGPVTGDNPLALEAADTIGYGIGILAKKSPKLQAKVEAYYAEIEAGGLTPAAVNGILDALGAEGDEYQFFAYKLTRILTRIGAKFEAGKVVDLQPIDPALLDAAKQAYLHAFRTAKTKV